MGKTLVCIHSYAGANEIVKLLFPYYKVSGCDLLGIGRTNVKCEWSEPIMTVDIGEDPQKYWVKDKTDNLCRRLVDTVIICLLDGRFKDYTDFCIIEYDGIFLKPIPEHQGGLCARLAGGPMAGFTASKFFHTPWWFDRKTGSKIVTAGMRLLSQGRFENGSPDVFLGLITDFDKSIEWHDTHTFSVNAFDLKRNVENGRKAIADGVWYVHGVKNKEQLDAILK